MGAQLYEADAISLLALLLTQVAYRLIVGYLHSIPVRLSKMPAHKSLTLHRRSFWEMVTILFKPYLPRKAADSTIIDCRGRTAH